MRRERTVATARSREEEARRRASEERLQIARELHDIVAHNISLINVQASVGLHLMHEQPEQAEIALTAIKDASRHALDEFRSVLEVLRGDDRAPLVPTSTLDDVDELVRRTAAAGLDVELAVTGERRPLPPQVDVAAYRLVQEALTNVVRHSGASAAIVRLTYDSDALVVEVDDDGLGAQMNGVRDDGQGLRRHARAGRRTRRSARCRTPRRRRVPGASVDPGRRHVVIRVVLADDQVLVRAGFRALLDAQDDIDVVGEASDGGEAVDLVRRMQPDVVLMDIRMPGIDGLEATRRISDDDALRDVKIVILTTFEIDEYVFESIRAGASGFLVKDTEPVELLRAVRAVADGDALLSPGATRKLIEAFATNSREPRPSTDLDVLTEREREVMALVAEGLTNDEIGDRLFVSPVTAKTHVNRAMTKLGARDRAQLVVVAYQTGLVRPGWLD